MYGQQAMDEATEGWDDEPELPAGWSATDKRSEDGMAYVSYETPGPRFLTVEWWDDGENGVAIGDEMSVPLDEMSKILRHIRWRVNHKPVIGAR